jgi:hypothetical protein
MSFQGHQTCISRPAGADLRTAQYKAVKINSSGQAVLAAAGDFAIGILQNKPNTGEAATIQIHGISKASADAAITAGVRVTPSADGQLVTSTVATDNTIGVALEGAGAAGVIFPLLLLQAGASVAD